MSRSHHIAKITSGAAIEHVRSYLLSEAVRLGLGEEVDAADCRKLRTCSMAAPEPQRRAFS